MITIKKNISPSFFSFSFILLLFPFFSIYFGNNEAGKNNKFLARAQSICKLYFKEAEEKNQKNRFSLSFFLSLFFFLLHLFPSSLLFNPKDLSTIAGENKYSYSGSPIGDVDLWNAISDLQINPNGTQIIFSDKSTNKIRKIDFKSS